MSLEPIDRSSLAYGAAARVLGAEGRTRFERVWASSASMADFMEGVKGTQLPDQDQARLRAAAFLYCGEGALDRADLDRLDDDGHLHFLEGLHMLLGFALQRADADDTRALAEDIKEIVGRLGSASSREVAEEAERRGWLNSKQVGFALTGMWRAGILTRTGNGTSKSLYRYTLAQSRSP